MAVNEPDTGKVDMEDSVTRSPPGQVHSPQDADSGSDTGEKPVRERLKHTTIAKSTPDAHEQLEEDIDTSMEASGGEVLTLESTGISVGGQGRPARKRSLEDLNATEDSKDSLTSATGGHTRKRSRDVKTGEVVKTDSRRVSPEPTVEEENEDISLSSQTNGEVDNNEALHADNVSSVDMSTPPPEKLAEKESSAVLSPRKKRSRDHLEGDVQREQKIAATDETRARRSSEEQRPEPSALDAVNSTSKIRDKANGQAIATSTEKEGKPQIEAVKKSSFGNISSVSPFGAMAGNKSPGDNTSETLQTSSAAFAASGFASKTGSTSPFGALASTTAQTATTDLGAKSPFASLVGASGGGKFSGFGSAAIGFGSGSSSGFAAAGKPIGSPFGTVGTGAKLTNFAKPGGDGKIPVTQKEKPFGAPDESASENDDSDADSEGGEEEAPRTRDDDEKNRFHVQDVDTGEGDEDTLYQNRAKLFQFVADKGSWAERGVGTLKLKLAHDVDDTSEKDYEEESGAVQSSKDGKGRSRARFIMRNMATLKVILNTPLYKDMRIEPKGKQLSFSTVLEGKPVNYTVKMAKEEEVKNLYKAVVDLQERL